jgi:hypothetical protein
MDEACSFCILQQERGNCKQTESPALPVDTAETQKKGTAADYIIKLWASSQR